MATPFQDHVAELARTVAASSAQKAKPHVSPNGSQCKCTFNGCDNIIPEDTPRTYLKQVTVCPPCSKRQYPETIAEYAKLEANQTIDFVAHIVAGPKATEIEKGAAGRAKARRRNP